MIFEKKQPAIILFRDRFSKLNTKLEEIFNKVGSVYKKNSNLLFVLSGLLDNMENKIASMNGITQMKDLPQIRIIEIKKEYTYRYKMPGVISENNLYKFLEDWKKGSLKPELKSQEDVVQDKSYTNVVGNNFEELVYDDLRDVVVLFNTDDGGCRVCFETDDEYNKVTKAMFHNKELFFARMNIEKNEVFNLPFKNTVPYLMIFKMGQKSNPIEYLGENKMYFIIDWLLKVTTNPISRTSKLGDL